MIDPVLFRCRIGNYYNSKHSMLLKKNKFHGPQQNGITGNVLINILCVLFLMIYLYVICLLMALLIKTPSCTVPKAFPKLYNTDTFKCELIYSCILLILYTTKKQITYVFNISNFIAHTSAIIKKLGFAFMNLPVSAKYTFWVASLNLILIVISNPTIINPGPSTKNHISVLYQNVRGFIPPGGLGNPNPPLCSIKLAEFQTYIYNKKPDIIILNETWLTKNVNDSEIFPNDNYKIFRLDRSRKTHPEDPADPDKYKKFGGGVLIAVNSELQCETTDIKIKCKAEILSIEIGLRNGKYICLSTFYRVTDLGAENHRVVDNYLRNIARRKKNVIKLSLLVTLTEIKCLGLVELLIMKTKMIF